MSALILISAAWVVALRNLFRAALSLGLVLVGVAGLFLLLEAEFLAFVQILIYVGAILTLVVFAIMLTPSQGSRTNPAGTPGGLAAPCFPTPSRQRLPAAAVAGSLFLLLTKVIFALPDPGEMSSKAVTVSDIGRLLVADFVLPFEVISLVFVASMVGAIVVAMIGTPNNLGPAVRRGRQVG